MRDLRRIWDYLASDERGLEVSSEQPAMSAHWMRGGAEGGIAQPAAWKRLTRDMFRRYRKERKGEVV